MRQKNNSRILTNLGLGVPASQQVQRAWEETSFDATEEESADEELSSILALRHGRDTDAPDYNDGREVARGPELIEQKVGWDFEDGVANEED